MACPLYNTEYQQYCCLHDKHQKDNTFEQCEYQQACSQLVNNQQGVEIEWKKKSKARASVHVDYLMGYAAGVAEQQTK